MNKTLISLVRCLADGEFHSGAELGSAIGVSRAAVWKQLQQLQDLGVEVESVKARGYRVTGGLELLDGQAIRQALELETAGLLTDLTIETQLPSTNAYLLAGVASGVDRQGAVCLAEMQTAGRGRRGRVWQSPFAANIYLSVAWRFDQGIAAMEGLSLATGVCICRALESLGYQEIVLKWPNDLLVAGAKLGGVLLEIAGDASGECYVVVGIGLNVAMPASSGAHIDQDFVDLRSISKAERPSRNSIVAALLNEILPMLSRFPQCGFSHYRDAWQRRNAHFGQRVSLVAASNIVQGVVRGVTDTGALVLDVDGQLREFVGGELSLRAVQ